MFAETQGRRAVVERAVGRGCGKKPRTDDPVWGPRAMELRRKEAGVSGAPMPTPRAVLHTGLGCSAGSCLATPGTALQGPEGLSSRGAHSSLAPSNPCFLRLEQQLKAGEGR